jgi:hypothetical protein
VDRWTSKPVGISHVRLKIDLAWWHVLEYELPSRWIAQGLDEVVGSTHQ